MLVNVKRLHPLAGQRYLLEALGEVIRTHPDTRLVICGTGPLLDELKAIAQANGVQGHVTFAGLVDNQLIARYDAAADAFVLPSLLEACPTVALEALADRHTGRDLGQPRRRGAGRDLRLRRDRRASERIRWRWRVPSSPALDARRRVRDSTLRIIEQDFRPPAVLRQFTDIYRTAIDTGAGGRAA